MVPLAEAWDSGASSWTAKRREAYANDQRQLSSLVAVMPVMAVMKARNRDKGDKADALCRYAAERTAT